MNNNDCFILVTPNRLILLIGEYANIIEKSKATEIYDWIRLKKDLGFTSNSNNNNKSQISYSIIDSKSAINFDIDLDNTELISSLTQNEKDFLDLIKTHSKTKIERDFQSPDEDEKFELLINDTNMVYKVSIVNNYETESEDLSANENDDNPEDSLDKYCLEPVEKYWGCLLRHSMLDEAEVFVFDFGTELYAWTGRNSSNIKKKAGLLLAKKLYEHGYDYSSCIITPMKPHAKPSAEQSSLHFKSSEARPKWTLLGKQSQNVESILFREKFLDWPSQATPSMRKLSYNSSTRSSFNRRTSDADTPPIIGFKTPSTSPYSTMAKNKSIFNFEPIIGEDLIKPEQQPVNLILENSSLGRGRHWFDEAERRSFDIVTESVTSYKIIENQMVECDKSEFGELVDSFTYVIKWQYKINAVGFRSLKGHASHHQGITGRDRYALFFWQGSQASQSEKGASALLSLDLSAKNTNLGGCLEPIEEPDELNESKSSPSLEKKNSFPHIIISAYKETPAFCQLFDGSMIIISSHAELEANAEWRMFELRGELKEESHLIEIHKYSMESLRSRASFLFVNNERKLFVIWHGCCSNNMQRSLIVDCTNSLANRSSSRFNYSDFDIEIREIEEDDEDANTFSEIFKCEFDAKNRSYFSLLDVNRNCPKLVFDFTPRLFLMTSLFGQFEAKEIFNPLRSEKTCHFPFYQFQLYEEQQPALFMFDNNNEIYIWQGWFEAVVDEKTPTLEKDAIDGTARIRFNLNRKCALQTAINYWRCKHGNEDKVPFRGFVVYAGLEPVEFTNLFPFWNVNENARSFNLNVSI